MSNEFLSQPWDFFSDPYVEINTYVLVANVDGVVTDYPATAARYRRNRCSGLPSDQIPPYMEPSKPGQLLEFMTPQLMPPAEAPNPILTDADVADAPIPPTTKKAPPPSGNSTSPSGQPPKATARVLLSSLTTVAVIFLMV
ncbi:putative glycerophosphodiester phosphodiesterase [Helianthus anomalus]